MQKSSEHSGQSLSHTRNEIHDVTPINFVFSSFNRVMLFDSLKEVYSKVHCDSILYVNPHNIGIIQPVISHNRNSPTIESETWLWLTKYCRKHTCCIVP